MFLNLPSRDKRLSLDFGLPRSKSYLSTLNNSLLNKQKSYSTASLKQEFKQFKNKSISYCNNNNNYKNVQSGLIGHHQQQIDRQHSPGNKRNNFIGNSYINNNNSTNGIKGSLGSGMKLNQFKKTYLNLDSKLNKTTKKEKDYFRPIIQQNINNNQRSYKNNNQRYTHYNNNKTNNPTTMPPSTYLQVQKRLQEQNSRRSIALMTEMNQLRQLNELLRRQNEEQCTFLFILRLKKQRAIDLDLIARQNEIMQKQQQLIQVNQQAIYINKLNTNNKTNTIDVYNNSNMNTSQAFTFSNGQQKVSLTICQQCKRRKQVQQFEQRQVKVENQFLQLKFQKMQEEKQLLKKQIHQLVYQAENHKQTIRKTQEKYQKQLQHNQKLLKIIQNMLENNPTQNKKHQSQYQYQQNINNLNRQPYLNLLSSKDILQQNQPISIKKDKLKNQYKQNKYQTQLNSPMHKLYQKNVSNFKSASNLIKFNNHNQNLQQQCRIRNDVYNEESKIRNYYQEKQKIRQKERQLQRQRQRSMQRQLQEERQSLRKKQAQIQKQKNLQWCQNQNIRKYLNEINQQKIRQIDQIQSLLKNQ